MNELVLRQQQTVDRVAMVGSAIAILVAAAFVTLDPIQTVARRSAPLSVQAPSTVAAVAAPEGSPLVQLSLPSPAWTVVSDGTWAAYTRVEKGQPAEVVVRSLRTEDWRVLYRAGESSFLGQLSLAKGLLALEEIVQPNPDATGRSITIRAISIASGDVITVDSFTPMASLASSPLTDGARVWWVRPVANGNEIRELDLATGTTRTVQQRPDQIAGLAFFGDSIGFTAFQRDSGQSYVVDLTNLIAARVEGFAYSYMQSIGPSGVVVTGATTADAPAASWLVNTDGTRTRLASDCFNVTVSARVLAMRCASQIEIRDLATASSLYRFAGNAGALAVFDGGVVWGEGDQLMLYELPSLHEASRSRPE